MFKNKNTRKVIAIRPAITDYDKRHINGPGFKGALKKYAKDITYMGGDYQLSAGVFPDHGPNTLIFAQDVLYYKGVQESLLSRTGSKRFTPIFFTTLLWKKGWDVVKPQPSLGEATIEYNGRNIRMVSRDIDEKGAYVKAIPYEHEVLTEDFFEHFEISNAEMFALEATGTLVMYSGLMKLRRDIPAAVPKLELIPEV